MRKLILETGRTDVDDCVALCLLRRNLDGKHRLLGVNVNVAANIIKKTINGYLTEKK